MNQLATPNCVTSDNLPKGSIVRATGLFGQGPREATVFDGKKGIIRCLQIHETNGHYPDIGDTYVDEITHVKNPAFSIDKPENGPPWLPFVLTDAHRAKLAKIRQAGF